MTSLGRDSRKPQRPPPRIVDEGKKSAALNFLTGISLRAEGGVAAGVEHAKSKPAGPLPVQRRPALHQYREHAAHDQRHDDETGGGAASAESQADGEPPARPAQETAGGAENKKTGRNQARYQVSMKFLSNISMSPSKTLTSLKSPFAASVLAKGEDAPEASSKSEQAEAHDSDLPGAMPVRADAAADRQAEEPHLQAEDVDQRGSRREGDSVDATEAEDGEEKKRGRVPGLRLVIPGAGEALAERPVSEGAQGRSKDFLSSISLGAQAPELADGATDWAVPAGVASAGRQGEGWMQSPARSAWAGRSYSAASSPSLHLRLSSSASCVDDAPSLGEASTALGPPAPNSARSSLNEKIGHKFEGIMGSLGIKSGDRKRNARPGPAARKAWKHAQLEWDQRQIRAFALVPSADKTKLSRTATLSPAGKPRAVAVAGVPILERMPSAATILERCRTSSLTTTPCGSLGDTSELAVLELQGEGDEAAGRWSARSSLSSDEMAPDLSKLAINTAALSPQTSAPPPPSPSPPPPPHLPSADAAVRGRGSPDEAGGGGRRQCEDSARVQARQARTSSPLAPPSPPIAAGHAARADVEDGRGPRMQEREDGRRRRREARDQRQQRRREAKEAGLAPLRHSSLASLGLPSCPWASASASSSEACAAPPHVHKPPDMLCEVPLSERGAFILVQRGACCGTRLARRDEA